MLAQAHKHNSLILKPAEVLTILTILTNLKILTILITPP